MAKAVGIDIGSRACKVAVVDGSPKGARLLRFVEREYEYGESDALTPAVVLDAMRKALAAAKAPKNAASVALAAEQCILREISVPFDNDDQIQKVVKFEFEPHLHNAAIEDVVLDYVKTGPARKGTRLLVFAARKDVLTSRLERLKQAGVDPLHIDVDVAALFNTAHASGIFDEHPNCLIIDIGARTTKTLYVQSGRLKVARSIRLGTKSAERRLSSDFQGDEDAAARALEDAAGVEALAQPPEEAGTMEIVRSIGAVETAVARSRQDEFMQRVMRETQRTLPMMTEDEAVSCVFVTGGGVAQHPNTRTKLEERFGVPVLDLPVADAVAHDLPPSETTQLTISGAVAVGTALKVLGIDAAEIDLRREDFRFARTFDQVKNAMAFGVTLLFFAVFLLWLSTYMKLQKADGHLGRLVDTAKTEIDEDVFKAYAEEVRGARKIAVATPNEKYFQSSAAGLGRVKNHLKNELGLGTEVPPIVSCLESWQAVMSALKAVRKDVKYMAVTQEDFDQEKIILTIVVGDYPDIDNIKDAIRKFVGTDEEMGIFESVENRPPRTKEGRIEVPIEIVIRPREKPRTDVSRMTPPDDLVRTAKAGDR